MAVDRDRGTYFWWSLLWKYVNPTKTRGRTLLVTIDCITCYFLITENIALYKSCDQSTNYSGIVPAETFLADLACDGDESTFIATDNEQLPWLSIDIGNVYTITSVDILFHGYDGMYIELQIMIKFNWLWPSDATWRNWSGSALVQVIAGFLTVPNHNKNQYWPISIEVLCYS